MAKMVAKTACALKAKKAPCGNKRNVKKKFKSEAEQNDQESLLTTIVKIVKDYGVEIFCEENEKKLLKVIKSLLPKGDMCRRKILFLLAIDVPCRLVSASDCPQKELRDLQTQLFEEMVDFGLAQKNAKEILESFVSGIGLNPFSLGKRK